MDGPKRQTASLSLLQDLLNQRSPRISTVSALWVRANGFNGASHFPKLSDVNVVNHSDKRPPHDFTGLGNRHPEIIKYFPPACNSIAIPAANDDPAVLADGVVGTPLAEPPVAAFDFFGGMVSWRWALQLVSHSGGAAR
jgi:hypothetical protein